MTSRKMVARHLCFDNVYFYSNKTVLTMNGLMTSKHVSEMLAWRKERPDVILATVIFGFRQV